VREEGESAVLDYLISQFGGSIWATSKVIRWGIGPNFGALGATGRSGLSMGGFPFLPLRVYTGGLGWAHFYWGRLRPPNFGGIGAKPRGGEGEGSPKGEL